MKSWTGHCSMWNLSWYMEVYSSSTFLERLWTGEVLQEKIKQALYNFQVFKENMNNWWQVTSGPTDLMTTFPYYQVDSIFPREAGVLNLHQPIIILFYWNGLNYLLFYMQAFKKGCRNLSLNKKQEKSEAKCLIKTHWSVDEDQLSMNAIYSFKFIFSPPCEYEKREGEQTIHRKDLLNVIEIGFTTFFFSYHSF